MALRAIGVVYSALLDQTETDVGGEASPCCRGGGRKRRRVRVFRTMRVMRATRSPGVFYYMLFDWTLNRRFSEHSTRPVALKIARVVALATNRLCLVEVKITTRICRAAAYGRISAKRVHRVRSLVYQ